MLTSLVCGQNANIHWRHLWATWAFFIKFVHVHAELTVLAGDSVFSGHIKDVRLQLVKAPFCGSNLGPIMPVTLRVSLPTDRTRTVFESPHSHAHIVASVHKESLNSNEMVLVFQLLQKCQSVNESCDAAWGSKPGSSDILSQICVLISQPSCQSILFFGTY